MKKQVTYSFFTHSYCIIEHTDPPKCTDCNQLLSDKHILTGWLGFNGAFNTMYFDQT